MWSFRCGKPLWRKPPASTASSENVIGGEVVIAIAVAVVVGESVLPQRPRDVVVCLNAARYWDGKTTPNILFEL
jgi:hypothetical protein